MAKDEVPNEAPVEVPVKPPEPVPGSEGNCCRPDVDEVKQTQYKCPDDGTDFVLHKNVPNKQGNEKQDLYHCPSCHKDFQKGPVENPE